MNTYWEIPFIIVGIATMLWLIFNTLWMYLDTKKHEREDVVLRNAKDKYIDIRFLK